jgi:hypothetical protein
LCDPYRNVLKYIFFLIGFIPKINCNVLFSTSKTTSSVFLSGPYSSFRHSGEIADEKDGKIKVQAVSKGMPEGAVWSGEKNRGGGFGGGEQDITIDFGDKANKEKDVL